MRGGGAFEHQKKTVSSGSSPEIDIEAPTPVEIGEALPTHRDPQLLPLADVMPGLDVAALGTLFLNYPTGEVRPRLDLYGSGLAW